MTIAICAEPIMIGNLVQAHIKATYPKGVVLVCSVDLDDLFDTELIREAFGEAAVENMCSDVTEICVIRFEEGATPQGVKTAMVNASEELVGKDTEEYVMSLYTIYENGEPVL